MDRSSYHMTLGGCIHRAAKTFCQHYFNLTNISASSLTGLQINTNMPSLGVVIREIRFEIWIFWAIKTPLQRLADERSSFISDRKTSSENKICQVLHNVEIGAST